jgi:glycerophosphoryl diester phosphodiesterase
MTTPTGLAKLRGSETRVIIYGHRGARGLFAENTMPGFGYLTDIGIGAIEFDVLATSDGVPVLTHNPRLSAQTTRGPDGAWLEGEGPAIFETPLDALQRHDVGAIRIGTEYHAKFPDQARLRGVAIPTLDAFCNWAAEQADLLLMAEIKSFPTRPQFAPAPADLVAATLAPLRAHGLIERSVLQSFDWRVLDAVRVQAPGVVRSYLSRLAIPGGTFDAYTYPASPWMNGVDLSAHDNSVPQTIADIGGHVWCPYFEDLTQTDLDRAHALGLVVNVWTVNTTEDLHRMAEMGVDGIITDYPARAQNVLAELGRDWNAAP